MTVFMKEMILEKVVFFMRGKSVVHHFVTIRLSYRTPFILSNMIRTDSQFILYCVQENSEEWSI